MVVALLLGLAATLYSSVGHGGASAYLAVMALASISPGTMRPTALILNILVAAIATVTFYRAGHFNWRLAWPFLISSIPLAWLGGRISLPNQFYYLVVGLVLLLSGIRLLITIRATDHAHETPPTLAAVGVGGALGMLAGLTGVGGGIFLSPLLLLKRWATLRTTAAVSAVFILANSIAGLVGQWPLLTVLPPDLPWWCVAVVSGGIIGAQLGARRLPTAAIRGLLAAVLAVAGVKLILSG